MFWGILWTRVVLFQGKFLWPGFGENIRVLDWVLKRIDNQPNTATKTPIGLIPAPHSLNLQGLEENVDLQQLFDLPKDFWLREVHSFYILNLYGKRFKSY